MKTEKIQGMVDTLKEREQYLRHTDDALDVLLRAQQCWCNLRPLRDDRERCYRYTYNNQWLDKITVKDDCGNDVEMTEEAYLRSIGQTPLQQNLIRRLVRTVLGVYRSQMKEPTCVARDRDEQKLGDVMSTLLQYNHQRNRMQELNARSMEEFLISAVVCHRKSYGRRNGVTDCWTDYVNPSYFFFDSVMSDFRMWDCSLVGEIHDISFGELVSTFAKTQEQYKKLSEEYMVAKDQRYYGARYDRFFSQGNHYNDFLIPKDPAVCRVFEVWTLENKSRYHCHDYATGEMFKIDAEDYKEEIEAENARRIKMAEGAGVAKEIIDYAKECVAEVSKFGVLEDGLEMPVECRLVTATPFIDNYWYFRFITPTGMVLSEGETPYKHGSHPYVFRVYPFINGEAHSFVADTIDLQRQINRTATQIDLIARSSAKGVLMIPASSIPEGSSAKKMSEAWNRPTATIVYNDDHGRNPKPSQENSHMNTSSLESALQMQQKMLEDASGIHGAAQGKPGASSVSGVLYSQQAQNSTMTLLDILDTFSGFEQECALKDCANIQQYYDTTKILNIAGAMGDGIEFDPSAIKDIEYDIAIGESTTTPAYRQLTQDYYNQWLQAGMIDLEQALEFGSFPNGDALLQSIRTKKEEAEKAQQEQMMAQQQAGQQAMEQPEGQPTGSPSKYDIPEDPTMVQPETRPDNPLEKFM